MKLNIPKPLIGDISEDELKLYLEKLKKTSGSVNQPFELWTLTVL